MCSALRPPNLVVCDLGCGSGDNTLIFLSEVISASGGHNMVGVQFFLNDLPGNDFNRIFQSVEQFKNSFTAHHKGERLLPFYIAGLSGSYYTRLFPSQSVHLFHSSYSLHWQSQVHKMRIIQYNSSSVIYNLVIFIQILECSSVYAIQLPDGLDGSKRNIYIAKATSPPCVAQLYQEQFQKDMMLFLELRYDELVVGRKMVLTFLGRKEEDVYSGNLNYLYELLSQSLRSLVDKV